MIDKGTVSALLEGGKKINVKPYLGDIVTVDLVVPYFLFECLEVGMPVVYVTFEDNTGIVLARMDGEWSHKLRDGVEVVTGDVKVTAGDIATRSVASYNSHTHTCPDGETSGPT